MNHLLAKSLLRRLSTGGNGSRCVSHSVAPVSGKILKLTSASSLDEMSLLRRFQDSGFLVGLSTRMMTTNTDPTRLDENGAGKGEKDFDGTVSVNKDKNVNKQHAVSSYWGISRPAIVREDGSNWPWNCFMIRFFRGQPWETYQSNLSIDLNKHHKPTTFLDKVAFRTVKLLRIPTDIFFQRRYGCRAMMLETVATVPGMVGGMLLHLRSLRKFEQSGGWIKALLEEAENERMHLMTMVELVQPKLYDERLLALTVQGVFFNAFFVLDILSPKLAHRVAGYLEEEAIHSYTEYLKDIDNGNIKNVSAPAIAIDYWRLPKDATLKDVVTVIQADEAHHRNHFASVEPTSLLSAKFSRPPKPLGTPFCRSGEKLSTHKPLDHQKL